MHQMSNLFYKYQHATCEELVADESFVSLINQRRTDPSVNDQWLAFVGSESVKSKEVIDAALIILGSAGLEPRVTFKMKEAAWQKISEAIQEEPVVRTISKTVWWRVAAAIVFLIIAGAAFYFFVSDETNKTVQWHAGNMTRTVVLPDSSVVTVGVNSTLTYNKVWATGDAREVWLDGDAEFDIVNMAGDRPSARPSDRFIVHLGDGVDVEVLGTVFGVTRSSSKITVELKSGSVKVDYKDRNESRSTVLKPLEKAEYDLTTGALTRLKSAGSISKPEDGEVIQLENTTVAEIISMIEKNYNQKIEVADSALLERRINGSLPIHSENDLWFVLINVLDIDVEIKSDDHLLLKPR